MIKLNTILTTSIEVMGINILPRCVSIRISPGSFPNQLSNQGARCKIAPVASKTAPTIINQRAICSIMLKKRQTHIVSSIVAMCHFMVLKKNLVVGVNGFKNRNLKDKIAAHTSMLLKYPRQCLCCIDKF
jgi:hypothetical protein